jgi:MFS transporter, DHA1 family, staphyloferrin A biosynthesis exporter
MTWNNVTRRIRNIGTFSSFKNRAYRAFFFGMIGQWSSFSMDSVARSYLVYDITNSPMILGIMSLASAVPMLTLALFGGAIADRLPKKRLIQMSQVAMTAIFIIQAVAVSVGYLGPDHPESWWVLMMTGVMMGIIMAIAMPSRQAIIPELIGREQLMNAISLNTLGMSFFQLVGPAVAGYIIDAWGYDTAFYIMAGLNALAILFTSLLPNTKPIQKLHKSVMDDIVKGARYIAGHKTVMTILAFLIITVLLAMPFQALMPIFAKDILKVGVQGQGTLMSISGIGALAASFTLASLPSKKRGLIVLGSNVIMGGALVVFAFTTSWPLALAMMVMVGIGRIGNNTAGTALLQTHTEPEFLGRVMSIMMLNFGLSSLGTFFASIIADKISAQWAIGGMAIALVLISIWGLLFIRRLTKLE